VTGWWRGLDRADRILVGLALAGLAIKVWMYLGIAGGPLVGMRSTTSTPARAWPTPCATW